MTMFIGIIVVLFVIGVPIVIIISRMREYGVKQGLLLEIKEWFYEIIAFLWSIFCLPFVLIRNLYRWIFKR
ncbi:hypothetical protein EDD58_1057 [Hazenella coriacea]|uniref:Uncharacterized protein n=1 Tax=Hazenella coriacea TaxID=1179467 RepID=A0A4R3L4V6_9BACL|nr:hypothetical protein EDD58_1057 [Hazenella coriacea]